MSGYNNTRSAFAGAVLGAALLTGMWAWSADYPPQGGGSAFLGDLSGSDLTLASGDEIVWNGDTFVGRSAAGTAYVGATTGTADGTWQANIFTASDGSNAAPTHTFKLAPNTGMYRDTSGRPCFVHSSNATMAIGSADAVFLRSDTDWGWNDQTTLSGTVDTRLERESAGVLLVSATNGAADGTVKATIHSSNSDCIVRASAATLGAGNLGRLRHYNTDVAFWGIANSPRLTGGINMRDDYGISYGSGYDMTVQGEATTLVNNTASTVFSVVTGDGDMAGLVIDYVVQATDTTEYQSECGTVRIAIVDDAGGVVASTPGESSVQALSSGTLTTAWTVVTTDDQSIEVQLNANTSLTPTTLQVRWKATYSGDVSLTVP